jgi:hypothetical protein
MQFPKSGMVGSWVRVAKCFTPIATPNIIAVEHVQLLMRGLLNFA